MHFNNYLSILSTTGDIIQLIKVTSLVYAIYFPTIDFFLFFLDNTTISTSYYVNCFFAKKIVEFFLNGHWSTYPPKAVLLIYFLKTFYFCVTTSTSNMV